MTSKAAAMKTTSMKSALKEMRRRSGKLDKALEASAQRRELALALYGLRRRAGLSQAEVAHRMGKTQPHVSRMESATGPFPDGASIEAYAQACDSAAGIVFVSGNSVVTVPLGEKAEGDNLIKAMRSEGVEIARAE